MEPGSRVGRFRIERPLGQGAMGSVYLAIDPEIEREVAIKIVRTDLTDSDRRDEVETRFLREAKIAGRLQHPNIVTIYDVGREGGSTFIAMEYVEGRPLAKLLRPDIALTDAQRFLIARQTAEALAHAHERQVVHRDVKPGNILIRSDGVVKVSDFGIGKLLTGGEDVTRTGMMVGSPSYMSPEQIRGDTLDGRSDVFSLGVVLYELLTDVKPFRGESLAQIRDAVLNHEPPLANKVDPAVPKPLAAIAARAMAKDPEHRFRSARSLARELRQWLDENPANADGEKTAPFAAPPPGRSRVVIGAAVAAGVAAVMAAIATWFLLMPAAPALAGAPAGEDRSARVAPAAAADIAAPMPTPAPVAPPINGAAAPDAVTAPTPTTSTTDATIAVSLGVPIAAIASLAPTPSLATPSTGAAPAPAAIVKTAAAAPAGPTPATPPRESAKDKKAREAREREARENDARIAAAAKLVAPATGTVKIAISPWGLVEVDGTSSGAAPPITELTLAEGRHQIVVRNGDYAPHTVSVNVTAGQTISVRHKFGS
jgi:serine/threonine-protein kinase